MDQLTETQKLRAVIAAECKFDLKQVKPIYDFIMGDEATTNNTPSVVTSDNKPDGIYYVLSDKSLVFADGAVVKRDDIIGVAVKQGDKVATVALHDAVDGKEIPLCCTESCGTSDFFYSDSWDAIADWDGEANTKDMAEALNPGIDLQEGQYIPSVAQLYLVLMNVREVNQALVEAGGTPMRKKWYWTSTESSAGYAWYVVYFGSGGIDGTVKYGSYVVRPAVAYRV